MDSASILGVAIVIATFTGPLSAVVVTRRIDNRRLIRERRLAVFRSLMATRRATLSQEQVTALNMVEIEFYGIRSVQDAHREVMAHINARGAPDGWNERHRALLTRLLSEMARVLGHNLQQLDVLKGGYYPQGFLDLDIEQQAVRRALIEVLSGRRPLAVSPAAPAPPAPFPPPPPGAAPAPPDGISAAAKLPFTDNGWLFSITFTGAAGSGFGMLVLHRGVIAGADIAGATYDGSYTENSATQALDFQITMNVPAGATPVQTGIALTERLACQLPDPFRKTI